jgi:hypothetical protein
MRMMNVGFHLRKFSMTKINYEFHDNLFLAIINAFEAW